jgi:YrbI family 3-deoxy-D-manno-octulosonate 8-phosphate phosphatase|tara:strand:- start:720 stop:1211 length:492 start_codon:yes stop_codon:yes gene_type:complete
MKKELYKKFKEIKLVLTDVDGVLTDGGMYYTTEGDIMKKFHARDGMGVTLLRKHNIPTILITKEKTKMVKQWAAKMKVEKLYDGIIKKNMILDKVCKTFNLKSDEIAYIGDDVNDVPLLKVVCLAVTPNDGTKEAKSVSHYICKLKGGEGAFREFADLIISTR